VLDLLGWFAKPMQHFGHVMPLMGAQAFRSGKLSQTLAYRIEAHPWKEQALDLRRGEPFAAL